MKKLLCYLMLLMNVFASNAQNRKIVIDKIDNDVRIIEAQGTMIGGFTATKILFIGLQTWVTQQDTTFVIVTNVNTSSRLGAFDDVIMLIKTMDDEVLELYSITSDNNIKNISYGNPTVTTTRYKNIITSTYNSNSVDVSRNINYWYVTPEIIEKLKVGNKKIKIQFENGVYSRTTEFTLVDNPLMDDRFTEM